MRNDFPCRMNTNCVKNCWTFRVKYDKTKVYTLRTPAATMMDQSVITLHITSLLMYWEFAKITLLLGLNHLRFWNARRVWNPYYLCLERPHKWCITFFKYEMNFGAAEAMYRLWYAIFDVFTWRTNISFCFSTSIKSRIFSVGPDNVQLVELLWQAISISGGMISFNVLYPWPVILDRYNFLNVGNYR